MFTTTSLSWFDALGGIVALLVAAALLRPRVRDSDFWRATVTPLASIIGSGFLVVAPLLASVAGSRAGWAMFAIVLLSMWIGSAIRFNIRRDGRDLVSSGIAGVGFIERVSDISLAVAYLISVAFYIRLMAAFVLTVPDIQSELVADGLATAVLLYIGFHGRRSGLHGLERLEEYSVTVKLAIIAALLLWLLHHDVVYGYELEARTADQTNLWDQMRFLAGMILVVQGFETSKYLDSAYSSNLRARTMTWAQIIAGVVYVSFVLLVMPLMGELVLEDVSETSLIEATSIVTPILPMLLVVAAVMSQFSAAIADTLGAGGVVHRESGGKLSTSIIYPIIVAGAIVLLWSTNIFQLVSIASRAFAVFYCLQALLAVRLALSIERGLWRFIYASVFAALAVVMVFVVIFGQAVEA